MNFQDFLNEGSKITLKRRYTENHPAVQVGKSARVRNKMLEAIADGKITQEEFDAILKEYSKDSSKWIRRNTKYFNVSEDGISLSIFGKRALSQIAVIEEGRAFVAAAKKAKDEGKEEFEFDGETFPVTIKENSEELEEELEEKAPNLAKKLAPGLTGAMADTIGVPRGTGLDASVIDDEDGDGIEDEEEDDQLHEADRFEKEAKDILSDLMDEFDPWELTEMMPEEAEETVARYGHKGPKAKKIADHLYNLASTGTFESKNNNKEMENNFVYESFGEFVESLNENKYASAGKLGYNDQFLDRRQSLSKTLSLDLGLNPRHEFGGGDWLGFDYVSLYTTGGRKAGTILDDALTGKYTYDELKAAAAEFLGIKESVTEAKSFSKSELESTAQAVADARAKFKGIKTEVLEFEMNPAKGRVAGFYIHDKGDKYGPGRYWITDSGEVVSGFRHDTFGDGVLGKVGSKVADFVKSFKANESVVTETEEMVVEAFQSMKLQSILTGAGSMSKDFAKAFYGMTKLQLDKITDADIIEMDPDTARKEKRNNAVYLYFTSNEKENPYAGEDSWRLNTIPANTLLGATNGKNEWLAADYQRRFSASAEKTLKTTKKEDAAGFNKSNARDSWGSGISSITKVAELADRAYVLDLDILRARYSAHELRAERKEAKSGATAFKSDKDFKKANLDRYHMILADRAAKMPIDAEVLKAIDIVTNQIKDGLTAGKKGRYGDVIIGTDPKGREVKVRDASNVMSNLLDDFNRYVDYTEQAKREEGAGYGSNYYSREVKNYAKSIKDRINKIKNLDYAW